MKNISLVFNTLFIAFLLLGFFTISLSLTSCNKVEIEPLVEDDLKDFNFNNKTSYDLTLEKLAFAMNKAIKNSEFKSIIKKSVCEGYTHDFDVPIASLKTKSMSKSTNGMDVGLFLERIINPNSEASFKKLNHSTFLDSLCKAHPDLIISIPVNINMIDEGVEPYVLFIPEDFQDATYKSIRAINPKGEVEYLSLKEDPQFPVIVIRKMEGEIDIAEGQLNLGKNNSHKKSKATTAHEDINLVVQTHNAGVQIQWTKRNDVASYKLYRYKHTVQIGPDNESFEYISTFTNSSNNIYVDEKTYSSMPNNVYFERYKMEVTYNDNYVAIYYAYPNENLADVKVGDVASLGNKIIQVNWSKITNDVLVGYNVYRASSVSSDNSSSNNVWDNGWLLCNSQIISPHLTSWTDYDSQKIPGKAYFYRVLPRSYSSEQDWNFQAASNAEAAKYINLAICSDRSDNAQLIATHIKTKDISKLEGWIFGKPEFRFAVFGYNSLNSTFESIEPKRLYDFSLSGVDRKKYNSGVAINKTMLLKWSNDLNMEIIAVVGYEHDDDWGGWDAIALNLKNLAIDLIQKTVQAKTGINIKSLTDVLKSQYGDTYAGGAYIIRSGKEVVTLKLDQGMGGPKQKQMPQGGVMLRISTATASGSWQSSWDNDIVQLADDKY